MKTLWKKLLTGALTAVMLLGSCPTATLAAGTSKMELKTEQETYNAGDVADVQIYIYDAQFNTAGFAISYDASKMQPVAADGTESTKPGQVIQIADVFDGDEGVFTVLTQNVDTESATVKAVFYVSPASGKTAEADGNGRKVADIHFKMLQSGAPDVKFTTIDGDVDFYAVPCLIVDNGSQMQQAEAEAAYGEKSVQQIDISQSVIEKKDAELAEQSGQNTSGKTGATDGAETGTDVSENGDGKQADGNAPDAAANGSDAADTGNTAQGEKDITKTDKKSGSGWVVYTIIAAAAVLVVVLAVYIKSKNSKGKRVKK